MLHGTPPRLAERKTGLEPILREIKNPASSAGWHRQSPITAVGWRNRAKLDYFLSSIRNRPHLIEDKEDCGPSAEQYPCRSPPDNRKV